MKIYNKRELQKIPINHSADIDYKDFKMAYRECTSESYSFLAIDTTLPANDPLILSCKNIVDMTLLVYKLSEE